MSQQHLKLGIDKKELRKLYNTNPYRVLFNILVEWLVITSSIITSIYFQNFIIYFVSVLIIGSRIHALGIIMHDVSHHRFFHNKKLSDFIINVLFCYPSFISVKDYRDNHLSHHKNLNTEDDPDWTEKVDKKEYQTPITKISFLKKCLSYLLFYQGIKDMVWILKRMKKQEKSSSSNKKGVFVYHFILFLALTITGGWLYYLLFWIVPFITTFLMFQYIRSFAEHFGEMDREHNLNSSRTVIPTYFEKLLISPYNVNFHIEHHLYPAVPYYNLSKLSKLLLTDNTYRENAHYTKGYFIGFLNELA